MFWTVQQTLIFPVLLLAGMLLPIDGGPGWLQTMSKLNPLTSVVDAERTRPAGRHPVDAQLRLIVSSEHADAARDGVPAASAA